MNMRKSLAVLVCLTLLFAFAGTALAKDVVLEGKITGVTEAVDRNGNAYVRAIIEEKREMNGMAYIAGVPVMFFGASVDAGKAIQAGDTLKCIATEREFQGRKSYTYLAPAQ